MYIWCEDTWLYFYMIVFATLQPYLLNFTRSWAFGFFKGISGFKVKLHHFEQPARRRVARKSVECRDFYWIRGPTVRLAFQRNWNSRKQSETVGNSRKQSETAGNSRKQSGAARHDQAKIVNPHGFLQEKSFRAIPFFSWKFNGKQLETVGNSWKQLGLVPLTRQKKGYYKGFQLIV